MEISLNPGFIFIAVENTIDTKKLDAIIDYKREMSKGVYKYTIGYPNVNLKVHGLPINSFGCFNTWSAWQRTEDKAAVAGDLPCWKMK